MAVQNDNTILKKADLKAYHEKIAPMLGGTFMVSTNNSDYYSTDEKVVGVYMGKPLYQKTILIDTLPNESQANFDTGIANATIDKIVYIFGWTGKKDNLYFRPFPYVYGGSGSDVSSLNTIVRLQNAIWVQKNTTSGNWDICIKTGYDRSVETGAVTLKYTKTTDAAGSATTTPGAYDINFPNTWPVNTEIYFGNGVYGKRYTGTFSATTSVQDHQVDAGFKSAYTIISQGGQILRGSNSSHVGFPYASQSVMYGFWDAGDGISTYKGLYVESLENGPMTNTYNVWVTYTK